MFTRGLVAVSAVLLIAVSSYAVPLSVRIDDYDFTFDTPDAVARYSFNGTAPDTITLDPNGGPEVGSLSVTGAMPGPLLPGFYGVYTAPSTFGGDLTLNLSYNTNDGPYVNMGAGSPDTLPVSLVGDDGILRITGGVFHSFPGAVDVPGNVVLLEILFRDTSLLSRDGYDTIDLIEAEGQVTTLLGQDVTAENIPGALKMFFYGEGPIFPTPGDQYQPSDDINEVIFGRISGETGMVVPEPMTMGIIALGLPLVLLRRRRR